MEKHRFHLRVPFGDVDHAGLVYYPNVFNYFHLAYEDFFARALQKPLDRFIAEGRAAPIVHSEADFRAPLRHGMTVEVTCWIRRLGRRSWVWNFEIRDVEDDRDAAPRVRGEITKVFVELATMRSQELDAEVRALVQPYVEPPDLDSLPSA